MGVPPALPGGSKSLTFPRVSTDEASNREPPSTRKEVPSMDEYESLSHTKMGVQIPRRVHSQVPEKDPVCTTSTASGGGVPQAGRTKGKQDRGGAPSSGPRAHDDFHPAEIRGVAGGRVHQGQECDPLGPGIRGKEAELRRAALLGQRVLCIHGRT